MTWFRVDDDFFDNTKVASLSDMAQLSFIKSGVYCARNLTDGFIPTRKAKECGQPRSLKELEPRFWHPACFLEDHSEGYYVHDFLDYNPTKAVVLAEREARHIAKVAGGRARAASAGREGGRFTSGTTSKGTSAPPAAHQRSYQHATS